MKVLAAVAAVLVLVWFVLKVAILALGACFICWPMHCRFSSVRRRACWPPRPPRAMDTPAAGDERHDHRLWLDRG